MKKLFLLCACCFFCYTVFALDGSVISLTGKVEIQNGENWVSLKKGDKIPEGASISTGFKATCEVKIGGSVVTIPQLSRITLTELKEEASVVKTEIYLDAGSVKNNVKPLNNKANDYKVKTAAVTSSVRGTVFTSYANGNVFVEEGKVEVANNQLGTKTLVTAGETYTFKEYETPKLDTMSNSGTTDNSSAAQWEKDQYGTNLNLQFQ